MVDALREAQRVLTPAGVLIDVHPVTAPILVELVVATQAVWQKRSIPIARQRTWRRLIAPYGTLYRADGLSSRPVSRSISRSIAIVPPS